MKKSNSAKEAICITLLLIVSILLIMLIFKVLIPIVLIGVVIYLIKRKKTPKIDPQPQKRAIPQRNVIDNEAVNAMAQEIEAMMDRERQIRQETDLRQFRGRNDVTRVELADYMFEQKYWDGAHERHLQMEEISKVCNITAEDIEWVVNELEHYHDCRKGTVLGDGYEPNQLHTLDHWVCLVRSEEQKAIWEYRNEQGRAYIRKTLADMKKTRADRKRFLRCIEDLPCYEKHMAWVNEQEQKNLRYLLLDMRRYDYEAWLRYMGYEK